MTDFDYDVVFIGSGHAAFHGAFKLLKAGKKVALIEESKLGGTCPNYGCDAKLLLDGPFEVIQDSQNYKGFGLDTTPQLNWEDLMAYKHEWIDRLPIMMKELIPKVGIDVYEGHGKLLDAHRIDTGDKQITADNIVLATGARDSVLPVTGKAYIHDSKDFLSIPHLPESIVFIGAGLISLEFASMVMKTGAKIEVIEFSDRALAQYDQKYVDKVIARLEAEGVNFHFNEAINGVQKNDNGYVVTTESGLAFATDYVFGATGRQANTQGLGLDEVGIAYTKNGISVDDHLRTSLNNVYVSGDVIDKQIPKLTPTATFESNYIASQILSEDDQPINYPAVPYVAYTLPRIAQIGVTPEQAQAASDKYEIKVLPYGQGFDTRHDNDAEMTVIFEKETQKVAGAVIYGGQAASLINILTFVVDKGLTNDDLEQMIFGFPDVTYSALTMLSPNGFMG